MIHYKNLEGNQTITLDLNESNSFDLQAFQNLEQILQKAKQEKAKTLLLRSNRDKIFSTGLNLSALSGEPTESSLREFLNYFYGILKLIYTYPTPVFAEVSGHAMGYGAMLALASDFRYGLENIRIGLPEVKIGIGVPSFIIQLLSDIIGKKEALDHVIWGNAFKSSEAFELGLFHELYSDSEKLKDSVQKDIQKLTKNSISAMIATKASQRKLTENFQSLIDFDIEATLQSIQSKDAKEGILASVSGRRPEFTF